MTETPTLPAQTHRSPPSSNREVSPEGIEYRVADAFETVAGEPDDSAHLVYLDDAWARPQRNGAFGVTYDTHPFSRDDPRVGAGEMDPEWTTREVLLECRRVLAPEGVLLVAADDWLLGKVLEFARREWATAGTMLADQYVQGQVTVTAHGREETTPEDEPGPDQPFSPDRSTPGMYLTAGGYPVVALFGSAGVAPHGDREAVQATLSAVADRQREDFGWGSAKPLSPHLNWVQAFTDPGDRILIPCAGTAPTAIATEAIHGADGNALAVDIEPEARDAYTRRRDQELETPASHRGEAQSGLSGFATERGGER
jgi:hypothetical protein